MANESQYNMSDHNKEKRSPVQFGPGAGENNSSADGGNTGQWKMKQRLEVTGS